MKNVKKDFKNESFSQGISFKCPHCGSALKLNPKTGLFACEVCESEFSENDLKRKTTIKQDDIVDEVLKTYSCPSCGAEIMTDENTSTDFCMYCGNPVVLKGRVSGQKKPNLIIPFSISKEEAKKTLCEALEKRGYVPREFFSEANLDKMAGVYYPFWETDVDTNASLSAEGTKITTWESEDKRYTKTSYYDIFRKGDIHLEDITVNGLKDADKTLIEGVLPYPIEKHIPFNMAYLSGFYAKSNDLSFEDVREETYSKMKKYSTNILKNTINYYSSIKILDEEVEIKKESHDYTLLPIWILSYKYKGKIYTFAINGVTGKVFGEIPISRAKLGLTFFGVATAIFTILTLIGGLFL